MSDSCLLILQIVVALVVCRVMGSIFAIVHQPRVVGEMFAGILLGPSFLGAVAPSVSGALFPISRLEALGSISQLSLVVFMFLVGLELDPRRLRKEKHGTILISHAGITVPFSLASILALYLYPRLSDDAVSFPAFALFLGAAMSITAFPVLARILDESRLTNSRMGNLAIACAAIDDVTGWFILAYIISLVRSGQPVWTRILLLAVFCLAMIFAVRPLLRYLSGPFKRTGNLSENRVVAILILILLSAVLTEWMGVHLFFGAFLLGTIMPKEEKLTVFLRGKFETAIISFWLPLFFVLTGLRTRIGLLSGANMWWYCSLIIFVACAGKIGGCVLAARSLKMPWRDSVVLGSLLNTRGLMELIILNIGIEMKVISPALFTMMVVMALVTTLMTSPILALATRENARVIDGEMGLLIHQTKSA